YNALDTAAFSNWLCEPLGLGTTSSINNVVIGDEVTRTCLIFLQDVTQMIGGAMLGALLMRLDRGARMLAISILTVSAWSLVDLVASAFLTGPILHWSDDTLTVLSAAQCAASAVWFWQRSRRSEALSRNWERRPGMRDRACVPLPTSGRGLVRGCLWFRVGTRPEDTRDLGVASRQFSEPTRIFSLGSVRPPAVHFAHNPKEVLFGLTISVVMLGVHRRACSLR
ncbi:MAG: hypothetical protein JO022_07565, partial [Acidobacteriaceae bacterium]|nr:hypothetical protein [Acidobacteriaceae bacterium]